MEDLDYELAGDNSRSYIADAVALARYFEDALPPKANRAFLDAEEGKVRILIPEVVIGEFVYITLKGRLRKDRITDSFAVITELLDDIETSSYLRQVSMSARSWRHFMQSTVGELHDRMIYSIAMSEKEIDSSVAIITNDPALSEVFDTVW
jgi:predicted nucleic acid-binding protein